MDRKNDKDTQEEIGKKVRHIQHLATTLPWLAVLGVLVAMIITILQLLAR